jgi:hypothetical protein
MNNFKLNGLVVPVPTPFAESGAIDFGAFLAHLDWLAECGVRNLFINFTTEYTDRRRQRLAQSDGNGAGAEWQHTEGGRVPANE